MSGQRRTGRVARVTDTGIKLQGEEEWCSYSRFHKVPHPAEGDFVVMEIDSKGFINDLEVMADHEHGPEPAAAASARGAGPSSAATLPSDLAVRLSLIHSAAIFCAARPELKAADVLLCAHAWERALHAMGKPS